jgi:inosose dehydratase
MNTSTDGAIQRFSFGYHLNTWDLADQPLDSALEFLARSGFQWFEALAGDSLGSDFGRRFMTLGPLPPPRMMTDVDIFNRFALFARARENYGIRLSSLYINAEWLNPTLWPTELNAIEVVSRMLQSCGAPILVCGGGPPGPHEKDEYAAFARQLETVGALTHDLGIQTVYHPHLDCFVQTRKELDQLMDVLDTDRVGLCIDPAHLQITASDPVDIVATYIDVIRYMHFKDCKGRLDQLQGHDRYLSFCELGAGHVDFPAMVALLLQNGYDGLVIIELDASEKAGEDSARESIEYVRGDLGLELTAGV